MKTFWQYLSEMDQPPPGVDPEMWSNPSYRKFWTAQNQQPQQQAAPQGWHAVPKQQQPQQGGMSETQIDNEIRSYLGNSESGEVNSLPSNIQKEIQYNIQNGNFKSRIVRNPAEARI